MTSSRLFKNADRQIRHCLKTQLQRFDRRYRFYDLSRIRPEDRVPRSSVVQFYSSVDNIGNYLPVLGIRKILDSDSDTWCMHDHNVDFDFINGHYRCAIIGGAGLLHRTFQKFWARIAKECRIPMVIWGVGSCFNDNRQGTAVDRRIAAKVFQRCDLIDFRDDITANFYNVRNAHISPCPSIVYLQDFRKGTFKRNRILLSSHEELVPNHETELIKSVIAEVDKAYKFTDNIQRFHRGTNDIIRRFYCRSNMVVTTRLHGAVIAYGLSIPYVAIPRDDKLRAFNRLYSNGSLVENVTDLHAVLSNEDIEVTQPVKVDAVFEFGAKVRQWIRAQLTSRASCPLSPTRANTNFSC